VRFNMPITLSKHVLALVVAIALASSLLVACGGDDDDAATTSATATATATPADEPDEDDEDGTATATATPLASTPAAATATAEPSGLGGTWSGTYASTSDPGSDGTFVLVWTQTGAALNGTINVANSECVSLGTITGTVAGSQITFGAVEGAFSISYEGTVAGNTMAGTYSSPPCGGAAGTWEASKQ
jgi:hypothetical protein